MREPREREGGVREIIWSREGGTGAAGAGGATGVGDGFFL
jgi:hypothetical protein